MTHQLEAPAERAIEPGFGLEFDLEVGLVLLGIVRVE